MRLSSAGTKAHDPSDLKPTTPLRQIAGNVAMTSTMGTAWYRLAAVPWSFRPDRTASLTSSIKPWSPPN